MVQKMEFKVGDSVEYKQLGQGPEKGKINFISRTDAAPTATSTAPAETAHPAPPVHHEPKPQPRILVGKYLGKVGVDVTMLFPEGEVKCWADLEVLKILAANPPKVNVGDEIRVQMVDQGGLHLITRVGPANAGGEFKTAKQIFEDNIRDLYEEKRAAAQAATDKANADGEQRMRDNEEFTRKLAEERKKASDRCDTCGHMIYESGALKCKGNDHILDPNCKNYQKKEMKPATPTQDIPPATEKEAPPKTFVKSAPALTSATPDLQPEDLPITETPNSDVGPVELGVHIDMGSYTNFDLKISELTADRAIMRVEKDGLKTISMMRRLMTAAKKGY